METSETFLIILFIIITMVVIFMAISAYYYYQIKNGTPMTTTAASNMFIFGLIMLFIAFIVWLWIIYLFFTGPSEEPVSYHTSTTTNMQIPQTHTDTGTYHHVESHQEGVPQQMTTRPPTYSATKNIPAGQYPYLPVNSPGSMGF